LTLYRVFPYDASAAPTDKGGALYVPPGGNNRIDNPDIYNLMYLSDAPEGAVSEVFGRIPDWDELLFTHPNGTRYSLVCYEIARSSKIYDLNNVRHLAEIGIKPAEVVIRDRKLTQQWARRIFAMHRWIGISWWSFYGPQWRCVCLWDRNELLFSGIVEVLDIRSDVVRSAADAISRLIVKLS
jgi:hypothetical protein